MASSPLLSVSEAHFNFFSDYEVTIDKPIDEVFEVLGKGSHMEKPVRLSKLCAKFELVRSDRVCLTKSEQLSESYLVRAQPTATQIPAEDRLLPRQFFHLEELVPIFLGFKQRVYIDGAQTWDEEAKVALYESDTGTVLVWKLRRFEEVEKGGKKKTKVHEVIKGRCPTLLRWIVQRETTDKHKEHMDTYHKLF
ncbi:hypothetical protein NLI96_g3460 [Meripilus lineatus]|uniref:Uncharacterized protein n=1 Tax=Meripilus lineatus TaxID=2056292 RepID=A0AAD5V8U8_9APHY|nr:hypothetical protein NLI96_g3460 [Physisporinus lineatus]